MHKREGENREKREKERELGELGVSLLAILFRANVLLR